MIEINADDADDDQAPDLQAAYSDLVQGLKANALPAETLKELSANFARASGLDRITQDLASKFVPPTLLTTPSASPIGDALFDLPIDTSHHDTARNTERMAESLEAQRQAVAQLVQLTTASLALTTEQREASERAERFSRRTTITSVIIAGASLGTSIAALIVAVILR
ncbi:hypothetical protein [Microbacterium paraoxydans]|uniref:Uncharacterized protein n=1 Tax=Microbacterium paraoxydans TaxID=199592 RepID=A0ABS5IMD7_9MICO|nr:hypothetical protein [Microbacterium paraoxydans]MBS0024119.1 hypothetical protein [Microbacterium paraoxydans]